VTADERLAQIDERQSKLEALSVQQAERIGALIESVAQLRRVLIEGNGRESIQARVAVLESKIAALEARTIPPAAWLGIAVSILLALLSLLRGVA
jgi:hypothetical protein